VDVPELDAQQRITEAAGLGGVLRWQALLGRLDGMGLIERSVLVDGAAVARLRQLIPGRSPANRQRTAGPVKLSRFAVVRADAGELTVARVDGHAVVGLSSAVAGVLGRLAAWTESWDEVPGMPPDLVRAVVDLLARAGLLAAGGPDDDQEATDPALAQWSPADLWLHATSRSPRLTPGYGGSYPLADQAPPLPAFPPSRSGASIALPVPDLARVAASDPPFTEVLERRRSARAQDDGDPITVEQLAELLYRCARARQVFHDGKQQLMDRPYPAGGSVHELEIYPLVTRCAGLPPGLYHYASGDHRLEQVAEPGPAIAALVSAARTASVMETDPQVVLIVTARFGRVMWKYHAIGYSLVLKDVGVLYQTIYLVATAMGLAVCGLGAGDAADFAAASGLPYHAEGSVGELVIGSRKPESGGPE
jgi:SagB-type dehydrogenase family enzyme